LLAATYWHQAGINMTAAEGQKLMFEAAAKALAIDPNLVLAQAYYRSGNLETRSILGGIEAFQRVTIEQPNNTEPMQALAWDLLVLGYLQEALGYAERSVALDPLSPSANYRLYQTLYAVGRTSEAVAALELVIQLGNDFEKRSMGEVNLVAERDEIAIAHFESFLQKYYDDSAWVGELMTGARDPASGQAYLDRRIPHIVASMPNEEQGDWQLTLNRWYLFFGFLDRYFELIFATDISNSTWTDSEVLIHDGTMYRRLGFTAHPKYLEVAESLGFVELWEQRGPPDFCEKVDSQWVCE